MVDKGGVVTFLNGGGGRAVATWTGNAVAGQRIAQWIDDGANDKHWTVVPSSDGYVKLRSARNSALYITAPTAGGAVSLQTGIAAGSDPAGDDAQEWLLVAKTP